MAMFHHYHHTRRILFPLLLALLPWTSTCFYPTTKTTSSSRIVSSIQPQKQFHSRRKTLSLLTTSLHSSQRKDVSAYDNDDNNHHNTKDSSFALVVTLETVRNILTVTVCSMILSLLFWTENSTAAVDMPVGKKYWSIMMESEYSKQEKIAANDALLDYAVGTINTQFYDNTGGNNFTPADFYQQWRLFRRTTTSSTTTTTGLLHEKAINVPKGVSLETREGAVEGLKWLVGSLNDPYSKYLTREELKQELSLQQDGFLGTGAIVEAPQQQTRQPIQPQKETYTSKTSSSSSILQDKKVLSSQRVSTLPLVTAIEPDSPAERAGLAVGDRIVAVGRKSFLGKSRPEVSSILHNKYNAQSYFGHAELTIAKPIYASYYMNNDNSSPNLRDVVLGYRQSHVRLPTKATESIPNYGGERGGGGDNIVHYQMLSSSTGSIFDHLHSDNQEDDYKVGYIRLTRFSKASTKGYLDAIDALEAAGAQSYILDLRNNYGGVIQEALLTASTLIRDPHAVLCYTMNARGAFTPHEVEEYVVDKRYPGYLLSKESPKVTLDQVHRESPRIFHANGQVDWDPPSSYASMHEQVSKRGMRRISSYYYEIDDPVQKQQRNAQKNIVLLINEGTASSAEVFAATLHDNLRTVALVGSKTYGKGLIQHTFPMPDGGGLRLTIAEYLTPSLRHVTKVGGANYNPSTGDFVGGGLQPDIYCESRQGIPGNIGADLCVGIALDALEENNDSTKDRGIHPPNGIPGETSQMMVKEFLHGKQRESTK